MGKRTSYEPGTFSWIELSTSDPDAAKGFYGELFGWEAEDQEMPGDGGVYSMMQIDGENVAAIMKQRDDQAAGGRAAELVLLHHGRERRRGGCAAPLSSAAPCTRSRSTSWTPGGWR